MYVCMYVCMFVTDSFELDFAKKKKKHIIIQKAWGLPQSKSSPPRFLYNNMNFSIDYYSFIFNFLVWSVLKAWFFSFFKL